MNTYSESLQLNVGEIKIKKTKLGRYKLKKRDSKDKLVMVVIAAMFFSLIYYLGFEVDYKWDMFSPHIAKKIVMDFFRFDLVPADEKLGMLSRLTNTVLLGLLTTLLGLQ